MAIQISAEVRQFITEQEIVDIAAWGRLYVCCGCGSVGESTEPTNVVMVLDDGETAVAFAHAGCHESVVLAEAG